MDTFELAQACLDLQAQHALNINMVTPTHFTPSVCASIRIARTRGLEIPVVWNTSGYETVQAIRAHAEAVDIYLTDMKYADARLGRALSGVADYPVVALEALEAMVQRTGSPVYDERCGEMRMTRGVIVRHMVLPGHAEDSIEVVRHVHERFGDDVRLSLMRQYTPTISRAAALGDKRACTTLARFPELAHTVDETDYERVLDAADRMGVSDYFWQEEGAASESFIPGFS